MLIPMVWTDSDIIRTSALLWRRSSACADSSCVEVAFANHVVLLRNSKYPESGTLVFSHEEWEVFTANLKVSGH